MGRETQRKGAKAAETGVSPLHLAYFWAVRAPTRAGVSGANSMFYKVLKGIHCQWTVKRVYLTILGSTMLLLKRGASRSSGSGPTFRHRPPPLRATWLLYPSAVVVVGLCVVVQYLCHIM